MPSTYHFKSELQPKKIKGAMETPLTICGTTVWKNAVIHHHNNHISAKNPRNNCMNCGAYGPTS